MIKYDCKEVNFRSFVNLAVLQFIITIFSIKPVTKCLQGFSRDVAGHQVVDMPANGELESIHHLIKWTRANPHSIDGFVDMEIDDLVTFGTGHTVLINIGIELTDNVNKFVTMTIMILLPCGSLS